MPRLPRLYPRPCARCWSLVFCLAPVLISLLVPPAQGQPAYAGRVALIAGHTGGPGDLDGRGVAARFDHPLDVAADLAGNVYVADTDNHTIRKIAADGTVSTFAGASGEADSIDGLGAAARFARPHGIATDRAGNVYVADTANHTIRRIDPAGQVMTLAGVPGESGVADGPRTTARYFAPAGIAVDVAGNVYVTDWGSHTVRRLGMDGVTTTVTGSAGVPGNADGTAAARFFGPQGITVDVSGNLYVADTGNATIRKITPAGVVSTLAGAPGAIGSGDGAGALARFSSPVGIEVNAGGGLYVADMGNHTLRTITPEGLVGTLAGSAGREGSTDAYGARARFDFPRGLTIDARGNLYVADSLSDAIRQVTPAGVVDTVAGKASMYGSRDGGGAYARFDMPGAIAADAAGNLFVADSLNHTIRKITRRGIVSTLAGSAGEAAHRDGTGNVARLNMPFGVAVDSAGVVYVGDSLNHVIRRISPAGDVRTLAGSPGERGTSDGVGAAARFNFPTAVTVDSAGDVYVADTENHIIRRVTPAGAVTTIAGSAGLPGSVNGTGRAAQFKWPQGIETDGAGNLYVADTGNHTIRRIGADGAVSTIAGTPEIEGRTDGAGHFAQFAFPRGLALDSSDNVYVADSGNQAIRRISPQGVVGTVAGRDGRRGIRLGALPAYLADPMDIVPIGAGAGTGAGAADFALVAQDSVLRLTLSGARVSPF